MANWKYKLSLKDAFQKFKNGEISLVELSQKVKRQIENLLIVIDDKMDCCDLENIKNDFEFSIDENSSEDDFDIIMVDLYDWADQEIEPLGQWPRNRLCWIETF